MNVPNLGMVAIRMFQRILTKLEREEIARYLETGKSSQVIRSLRHRAKKFLPVIEKDIELLKKLLEGRT